MGGCNKTPDGSEDWYTSRERNITYCGRMYKASWKTEDSRRQVWLLTRRNPFSFLILSSLKGAEKAATGLLYEEDNAWLGFSDLLCWLASDRGALSNSKVSRGSGEGRFSGLSVMFHDTLHDTHELAASCLFLHTAGTVAQLYRGDMGSFLP